MKRRIVGSATLVAMLALTGCASPKSTDVGASANSETTAPATTAAATPTGAPVSDIDAAVQAFVTALNELGIDHTDPVRAEVGLSGAKALFDITINGFDAGINVFPDAEALATWGEASDSFGGIYVAYGNAALSLNSGDGIADSAEIAPKIAAEVGGEAHGV